MPKLSQRQIQGQNSRDKLLDAATRLFHENGYQAVTVNDICEAAQLTKGAFYHHFDSKETLYQHLYTPQLDAYLSAHFSIPENADGKTLLLSLADATLSFSEEIGREMTSLSVVVMLNRGTSLLFTEGRIHTRLLQQALSQSQAEKTLQCEGTERELMLIYSCLMVGFLVKWASAASDSDFDWHSLLSREMRLMFVRPPEITDVSNAP
ncbi:MAG: helix-turn-helix domain-containing protein [Christensenellales bacterium]|nr:helix-turn-helix domain-containing protein [Christensenellales bacterium]